LPERRQKSVTHQQAAQHAKGDQEQPGENGRPAEAKKGFHAENLGNSRPDRGESSPRLRQDDEDDDDRQQKEEAGDGNIAKVGQEGLHLVPVPILDLTLPTAHPTAVETARCPDLGLPPLANADFIGMHPPLADDSRTHFATQYRGGASSNQMSRVELAIGGLNARVTVPRYRPLT
jgi:hypothetical protein